MASVLRASCVSGQRTNTPTQFPSCSPPSALESSPSSVTPSRNLLLDSDARTCPTPAGEAGVWQDPRACAPQTQEDAWGTGPALPHDGTRSPQGRVTSSGRLHGPPTPSPSCACAELLLVSDGTAVQRPWGRRTSSPEVTVAEGWREGPGQPPAEWQLLGLGEACTPTGSGTQAGLTAPRVEPPPGRLGQSQGP